MFVEYQHEMNRDRFSRSIKHLRNYFENPEKFRSMREKEKRETIYERA